MLQIIFHCWLTSQLLFRGMLPGPLEVRGGKQEVTPSPLLSLRHINKVSLFLGCRTMTGVSFSDPVSLCLVTSGSERVQLLSLSSCLSVRLAFSLGGRKLSWRRRRTTFKQDNKKESKNKERKKAWKKEKGRIFLLV